MATVTITRTNILRAEEFLANLLSSENPDADFSKGSVLRDVAVKSIAFAFAFLQSENEATRVLTRITDIAAIVDDEEREEAILNFLDNMFLNAREGFHAHGIMEVEFTQQTSGAIPADSVFIVGSDLVFVLDNGGLPIIFDETDLSPKSSSVLADDITYTLTFPVVSIAPGAQYNISAQILTSFTEFNPFILDVRVLEDIVDGQDPEDPDALLERAPDALTVRNLLTRRSINTVLQDEFSSIRSLQVVEFGDPEMVRDISPLSTPGMPFHTGGSVDVYVDLGLTTKVVEQQIGEEFTDASPILVTFRDLFYFEQAIDWRGFIEPGDLLRFYSSSTSEPTLYVINEVGGYFLRVQELIPFVEEKPLSKHGGFEYEGATYNDAEKKFTVDTEAAQFTLRDIGNFVLVTAGGQAVMKEIVSLNGFNAEGFANEIIVKDPSNELLSFPTSDLVVQVFNERVEYSVGSNGPHYDNKIARRPFGQVTQTYTLTEGILLPNEPIYRIRSVVLVDPENPDADPSLGGISFPTRLNTPPQLDIVTSQPDYDYQIVELRPKLAQSSQSGLLVRVAPQDTRNGVDGALSPTDIAARIATFSITQPLFSVNDEGLEVLIPQAVNSGNPGLYEVTSFIDPQTLELTKRGRHDVSSGDIAAEASLPWQVLAESRVQGILRVIYDALPGFSTLATFVEDSGERVVASKPLVRGFHPVYVSFNLVYELKATATIVLDEPAAEAAMVSFINNFDPLDILNSSDITTAFRNYAPSVIGNVIQPLVLNYTLYSPTGEFIQFSTNDAVEILETLVANEDELPRLQRAKDNGVSDRTVRYLTTLDLVSVTLA